MVMGQGEAMTWHMANAIDRLTGREFRLRFQDMAPASIDAQLGHMGFDSHSIRAIRAPKADAGKIGFWRSESFRTASQGTIAEMLKVVQLTAPPEDRHFLLRAIVNSKTADDVREAAAWQWVVESGPILTELGYGPRELRRTRTPTNVDVLSNLGCILAERGDYVRSAQIYRLADDIGIRYKFDVEDYLHEIGREDLVDDISVVMHGY